MASRQAIAALGCLQCRISFLRAVPSSPSPALRVLRHASIPTRSLNLPLRSFATTTTPKEPSAAEDGTEAPLNPIEEKEEEVPESPVQTDSSATPWYLEVEPPQHAPTQHVAPLPEIPEGSPPIFEPLLKYVYEEMGLDDMTLLDLRDMDPPPALGPNLMMLFGTARSERHLHVSSSRLVKWLRFNYRIESSADGLIGPGELKTKLRRLRKKAKLMGSSALPTGGDDGISTGWICVNLGTLGSSLGESARYDDDGKVSGFGSTTLGTTIVVQVMTESRRNELNLEHLWSGQLRRSQESEDALKGDEEEFIRKYGKKPPPAPRPAPASYAQNRQKFGTVQRRSFSTSRVLRQSDAAVEANDTVLEAKMATHDGVIKSDPVQEVSDIVLGAKPITHDEAVRLLGDIFHVETITSREIVAALELLKTLHERDMSVLNNDTIVTLIEALSRHEDDDTKQVLSNLEHLLMCGFTECPSEEHLKRLLTVFLGRPLQYWDMWQMPPRHGKPRSTDLYLFVLRQALATKKEAFIKQTLQTIVPSMEHEAPPVLSAGQVWTELRKCLLFLDPTVEELARTWSSSAMKGTNNEIRKLIRTELVRMYRRLDAQNSEAQRQGIRPLS